VVGAAHVPAGRKNVTRGMMGKKGHAWVKNPPYQSGRAKIPPLRGGSLALWCHRRIGVLRTPGSGPGSTTGPVGGSKALNSAWAIVQNKANLDPGGPVATTVCERSYERNRRCVSARKQSQFATLPILRAGSLALWSRRQIGALRTPGSGAGSTSDAVGGHKAVNSGWQSVQNKANFDQAGPALIAVTAKGYERYGGVARLRKQSQFAAWRLLPPPSRGQAGGAPRNDMTTHVLSSGRKTCLRERRHGTRLVCICPGMEIPAPRAGSLALWGHRHIGVLCAPGSGAGSTTGAVGGPRAENSGWAIVQNKANFASLVQYRPS
jgi:hypothetical protein